MVSCIGSDMGKAVIAGTRCVTNQQINSIVVDDRYDSEYVYYNLSMRKAELQHLASGGSTMPILNKGLFSSIKIDVPPYAEQRAISRILALLDDRITLLRETNTLLEQIAQTIFKSWFVDFDPVRAKQEGRIPEGMDEETAALFPDSFEESDLGMVPSGWKVLPFLEACDMLGGAQPPASTFIEEPREGYVRLLQIRDFSTDAHKTYIPHTTKLKKADEDDILIGRYGSASGDKAKDSLGRICRGLSGAYNVALMKLSPIEVGPEFALQLVNDPRFYGYLQGVSSKAVQSGFSKAELGQYKVVIPPRQIADIFEATGEAVWKRIKTGREAHRILAGLRDTLLPRLISGKLRLPEAEVMLSSIDALSPEPVN
jgi:type I restriction enzyme S subunit